MTATQVCRHFEAPRAVLHRAQLDRHAVARWMVPDRITSQVHQFDLRQRGGFQMSMTRSASGGGTQLVAVLERRPSGVPTADNETGWRMSLARLASLVEASAFGRRIATRSLLRCRLARSQSPADPSESVSCGYPAGRGSR